MNVIRAQRVHPRREVPSDTNRENGKYNMKNSIIAPLEIHLGDRQTAMPYQ
jgi:hypothetical protein